MNLKHLFSALFILTFAGCAGTPDHSGEKLGPVSSGVDLRPETAAIEDYILALPPYQFHEESVEAFADRVRKARTEDPHNRGKGRDYLYCAGDGCWPAKEFFLDRRTKTLTVRVGEGEDGQPPYNVRMRRVPGGWIRGKIKPLKNPES